MEYYELAMCYNSNIRIVFAHTCRPDPEKVCESHHCTLIFSLFLLNNSTVRFGSFRMSYFPLVRRFQGWRLSAPSFPPRFFSQIFPKHPACLLRPLAPFVMFRRLNIALVSPRSSMTFSYNEIEHLISFAVHSVPSSWERKQS